MAATAWTLYNEAKKYLLTADADLNAGGVRMKLIKGTAASTVSDFTRSTWATLIGAGSVTNLRTSGKKTPGTFAVTQLPSAKAIRVDSDDVIFTCSGSNATSILYAIIGISGGKALAWCKLTSSGTITVTPGNTLTVTINANGYFTLTGGVTP